MQKNIKTAVSAVAAARARNDEEAKTRAMIGLAGAVLQHLESGGTVADAENLISDVPGNLANRKAKEEYSRPYSAPK